MLRSNCLNNYGQSRESPKSSDCSEHGHADSHSPLSPMTPKSWDQSRKRSSVGHGCEHSASKLFHYATQLVQGSHHTTVWLCQPDSILTEQYQVP